MHSVPCWALLGRDIPVGAPAGLTRKPKAGRFVTFSQSLSYSSVCLKKCFDGLGTQQRSLPFQGAQGA